MVCGVIGEFGNTAWKGVSSDRGILKPLKSLASSGQQLSNRDFYFLIKRWEGQRGIGAANSGEVACKVSAAIQGGKLGIDSDHRIVGSSETIFLLYHCFGHRFDIWVMKEYNVEESWTRIFSIELDMQPRTGLKRILGVNRNGELILYGSGSWIGYSIEGAVKLVDLQPLGSYCAPHAEVYSESLVLLGDDDCVTSLEQNNGGDMQEGQKSRGPEIRRVPGKRRGKSARLPSIDLF